MVEAADRWWGRRRRRPASRPMARGASWRLAWPKRPTSSDRRSTGERVRLTLRTRSTIWHGSSTCMRAGRAERWTSTRTGTRRSRTTARINVGRTGSGDDHQLRLAEEPADDADDRHGDGDEPLPAGSAAWHQLGTGVTRSSSSTASAAVVPCSCASGDSTIRWASTGTASRLTSSGVTKPRPSGGGPHPGRPQEAERGSRATSRAGSATSCGCGRPGRPGTR